tara:strand:- start:4 stop:636 length:633 start_codon:yes stop_codon:yes gene_type:complete
MNQFFNNILLRYFLLIYFCLLPISTSVSSRSILNIAEDDFIIGNKDAPITIIEYASMSCSHCANFHIKTLPQLIDEYVDTGKIKIVFRDFPFNYPALLGSMVLRCIPGEARYEYTQALYKLQPRWVNKENAITTQELYKIMQSGGMTKEEFDSCIKNVDLEKNILQSLMDAQSEFSIKSTPSFLINGLLVEGDKPLKDFREIIDKLLLEE